eukprot:scaffold9928_cov63-Phaeocystis_antarctica.AAC.7
MHIEPFQSPVQQARGRTPRAPRPAAPGKTPTPTRGARGRRTRATRLRGGCASNTAPARRRPTAHGSPVRGTRTSKSLHSWLPLIKLHDAALPRVHRVVHATDAALGHLGLARGARLRVEHLAQRFLTWHRCRRRRRRCRCRCRCGPEPVLVQLAVVVVSVGGGRGRLDRREPHKHDVLASRARAAFERGHLGMYLGPLERRSVGRRTQHDVLCEQHRTVAVLPTRDRTRLRPRELDRLAQVAVCSWHGNRPLRRWCRGSSGGCWLGGSRGSTGLARRLVHRTALARPLLRTLLCCA